MECTNLFTGLGHGHDLSVREGGVPGVPRPIHRPEYDAKCPVFLRVETLLNGVRSLRRHSDLIIPVPLDGDGFRFRASMVARPQVRTSSASATPLLDDEVTVSTRLDWSPHHSVRRAIRHCPAPVAVRRVREPAPDIPGVSPATSDPGLVR